MPAPSATDWKSFVKQQTVPFELLQPNSYKIRKHSSTAVFSTSESGFGFSNSLSNHRTKRQWSNDYLMETYHLQPIVNPMIDDQFNKNNGTQIEYLTYSMFRTYYIKSRTANASAISSNRQRVLCQTETVPFGLFQPNSYKTEGFLQLFERLQSLSSEPTSWYLCKWDKCPT